MEIRSISTTNIKQPNFKSFTSIKIPTRALMTMEDAIEGCGMLGESKFLKAFYKLFGREGEIPNLTQGLPDPYAMLKKGVSNKVVKEALKIPHYEMMAYTPEIDEAAFNASSCEFVFLTAGGEMNKLLNKIRKIVSLKNGYKKSISLTDMMRQHKKQEFNIQSLEELPAIVEKIKKEV